MEKYQINTAVDRRGMHSVQFEGQAETFDAEGLLPAWIADMNIQTAPPIIEAIKQRAEHGVLGYMKADNPDVKDAIQYWWQTRFGITIDAPDIYYGQSILFVVTEYIRQLSVPGEGVLFATPSYNTYFHLIEHNDRRFIPTPLIYDEGNYYLDRQQFVEQCQRDDVKVFVHCNPHNPTGKVWTAAENRFIYETCQANDVALISDEVHMDFTRPKEAFNSLYPLIKPGDHALVVTGLGKTFNLAGIPMAYYLSKSPELAEAIQIAGRYRYSVMTPNSLGLTALQAAYRECGPWVDALNDHIARNIEVADCYIQEHLADDIQMYHPQGTYLLWLSFEKSPFTADEVYQGLIEIGEVAISPGRIFQVNETKHLRLNIASSETYLLKILERMKVTFDELHQQSTSSNGTT